MKVSKSIKLGSCNYVLFAKNQRIFVTDDYYYDEKGNRKPITHTNQILEWVLWITAKELKSLTR